MVVVMLVMLISMMVAMRMAMLVSMVVLMVSMIFVIRAFVIIVFGTATSIVVITLNY